MTKKEFELRLKEYCEMHNTRPTSRRDFLSAGLIGFTGLVFSGALPRLAHAADCPKPQLEGGLAPFVTINLRGGAMLSGNFVPHDQGEQPLPSYNNMGLGNGALPIEREFGNVPFAGNGISKILEGIRATASQNTITNTAFVGVNVRSRDDSGDNPFDASGMVAKAGLIGEQLPNLGVNDGNTGVNQRYALIKPPNPLIVDRYGDLAGATGGSGTLDRLTPQQKTAVFKLVERLNGEQVRRLASMSGGETLAHLVKCATGQNIEIAQSDVNNMDVRNSNLLSPIWGVNGNTGEKNRDVVFGSMSLAALTGVAGTIGLELGGYDYHNNTRTRGDQKDREAGELIGKVIESAAVLNSRVFIYVTTDGACRSARSESRSAPWTSDRGSAGCSYMLAFDPTGRPETNGFQLGHFTDGQAADENFVTGGSVELASAAVFANYLKFSGEMNKLNTVLPNTFNSNQLDQILKFA